MREFGYDVGAEGSRDQITVPVGFETDFASVPRPFSAILPKWGKYGDAAVIHDWLYWEQGRPRPAADAILLEGMTVLGVSAVVESDDLHGGAPFGGGWPGIGTRRIVRTGMSGCSRPSRLRPLPPLSGMGQYVQLIRHLLGRTRRLKSASGLTGRCYLHRSLITLKARVGQRRRVHLITQRSQRESFLR